MRHGHELKSPRNIVLAQARGSEAKPQASAVQPEHKSVQNLNVANETCRQVRGVGKPSNQAALTTFGSTQPEESIDSQHQAQSICLHSSACFVLISPTKRHH
jgi:hypothetical protein